MTNSTKKNQQEYENDWIDSTMNSYRGKNKVAPPSDLFSRIEEAISSQQKSSRSIKWFVPVAAAITLFCLNMSAIVYYTQISKEATQQSADIYFVNDYNLYDYE